MRLGKEFIAGIALIALVGCISVKNAIASQECDSELAAYQSPYEFTMEQLALEQKEKDAAIIKEAEAKKEEEPELVSLGVYKISAYCPCIKCCGKTDGITASGTQATAGRTAAMNGVPFGTRIVIDGHEYTVEDRGGGLGKKIIDIYFDSHEEALNSGLWVDKEVFQVIVEE